MGAFANGDAAAGHVDVGAYYRVVEHDDFGPGPDNDLLNLWSGVM